MILERTIEMRELPESSAVLQRFVLFCKKKKSHTSILSFKRSPLASPFIVPFKGQPSKILKDSSESCPERQFRKLPCVNHLWVSDLIN